MTIEFDDLYARTNFAGVHSDIWRNRHSEYWLNGGRGSAKSSFISLEIIAGMLADPEANAIVYRRVGATLKDSVYSQLLWAIDMLELDRWFKPYKNPLEIVYRPTGQRILFRGADDPMKSKSIKLDKGYFRFLWFEELSEFRGIEDIRSIKQSILRGNRRGIVFCSYNPPRTAQNWTNETALEVEGWEHRLVHTSTYLGVPETWLGDQFLAEADALKRSNRRAYDNEYLGIVTGTGGQVFDNLQFRAIASEETARLDRFYNGLDFGFAIDPDAFTRWAFDARSRTLYAIDEFYGSRIPTETLAAEILKRCRNDIVRCDSADPRMIDELKRRGIKAVGVKKGPDSREHGYRWLQDLGAIVIDRQRTPNIAREFLEYEYEQDRNGKWLPAYPDHDDHTCDSTRYALEPVIAHRTASTVSRSNIGI